MQIGIGRTGMKQGSKNNITSFKPGKSGNPNGRPKKSDEQKRLEELCRDMTARALDVIVEIMENGDNQRNKLSAAQYVIDRGWGKAKETVDIDLQGNVRTIREIHLVAPK